MRALEWRQRGAEEMELPGLTGWISPYPLPSHLNYIRICWSACQGSDLHSFSFKFASCGASGCLLDIYFACCGKTLCTGPKAWGHFSPSCCYGRRPTKLVLVYFEKKRKESFDKKTHVLDNNWWWHPSYPVCTAWPWSWNCCHRQAARRTTHGQEGNNHHHNNQYGSPTTSRLQRAPGGKRRGSTTTSAHQSKQDLLEPPQETNHLLGNTYWLLAAGMSAWCFIFHSSFSLLFCCKKKESNILSPSDRSYSREDKSAIKY